MVVLSDKGLVVAPLPPRRRNRLYGYHVTKYCYHLVTYTDACLSSTQYSVLGYLNGEPTRTKVNLTATNPPRTYSSINLQTKRYWPNINILRIHVTEHTLVGIPPSLQSSLSAPKDTISIEKAIRDVATWSRLLLPVEVAVCSPF